MLSISVRIAAFAVSHIQPVENAWTKTLQNNCCQIEVSFIAESFLIGKQTLELSSDSWKITEIAKLHYNAFVTSSVIIVFLHNVFCYGDV